MRSTDPFMIIAVMNSIFQVSISFHWFNSTEIAFIYGFLSYISRE